MWGRYRCSGTIRRGRGDAAAGNFLIRRRRQTPCGQRTHEFTPYTFGAPTYVPLPSIKDADIDVDNLKRNIEFIAPASLHASQFSF